MPPKKKAAPAPAVQEVVEPTPAPEVEEAPPEPEPPPRDHERGAVGHLFEDVFKDLYPALSGDRKAPAEGSGEEDPAGALPEDVREELELAREDDEIKAIHAGLEAERERVSGVADYLQERRELALKQDHEYAVELQQTHGLTVNEQYPVPESMLKKLLDPRILDQEGLIVPRDMMANVERKLDITKGLVAQHENLLSRSKPDEPNHYKSTASQKMRAQLRNIQPTMTQAQRTALSQDLTDKLMLNPRGKVASMNAEERAENLKVMQKMAVKVNFLKNPRYRDQDRTAKDRGAPNPFWISPQSVTFRNYDIGGIYEFDVEFRNVTKVGRRLRVIPPKSPSFSIDQLRYDGDVGAAQPGAAPAVVAPGMAGYLRVRFAPSTLNDQTEEIIVSTEKGNFSLPVLARRQQPQLEFTEPVYCGCILAGSTTTEAAVISNRGGEGSFRLIPAESDAERPEHYYSSVEGGETTLVTPLFCVTPALFYLEAQQTTTLNVTFSAAQVGRHSFPLLVECDNGVKTPLTLTAVADAVRVELNRWPTLSEPVQPRKPAQGCSPWSVVPWRMDWLTPGTQIGHSDSQSCTLANGGYLPQRVEWRLAMPPRHMLTRLAVGAQQRLYEDLLSELHTWPMFDPSEQGGVECPFSVEPASATIEPRGTASFTFTFKAHPPVGHRAAVVACLMATGLPAGRHCLLPFEKLIQLQDSMKPPPEEGKAELPPGLPLFGGAVSGLLEQDVGIPEQRTSCALSAVCLQGMTTGPSVACLPRVLALPGETLPFVAHTRELRLRNSGPKPAFFRVRLSSADGDPASPLWVVSPQLPNVGPRPPTEEGPAGKTLLPGSGEELQFAAKQLESQWPPQPPQAPGAAGSGALASCGVEPAEGEIPAGEVVVIRVTLRALREADLKAQLLIDQPVDLSSGVLAVPPIKVGVTAKVRSPKVELRGTSFLDFGVVRSHARHTATLKVGNPSPMPMLVRLRHRKEAWADGAAPPTSFPLTSHQEVVDSFLRSFEGGDAAGTYVPIPVKAAEAADCESAAEPWVHARSGCVDLSGKRPQGAMTEKEEDFLFQPACMVLWPRQSADVEVTLRTEVNGKYRALIEAVSFDSSFSQCVNVIAEVQLPQFRLSQQRAHFPIAYLETATKPLELELRNDSDMPADFRWEVPPSLEAGLQVQLDPANGTVPARSTTSVVVVATPTKLNNFAELHCRLFVGDVLQTLGLTVSANIFGPEVDYCVVAPGERAPQITHLPRRITGGPFNTSPVLNGAAKRSMQIIDFGEMELQKFKSVQLVLYNRTEIASGFSVKVDKNPSYEPPATTTAAATRTISGSVAPQPASPGATGSTTAAGPEAGKKSPSKQLQTFSSQPEPAASGRRLSKNTKNRFAPTARSKSLERKKRFLLDDKHEKQAFRSTDGAEHLKKKELKQCGDNALADGRGWAVSCEPRQDMLLPFSTSVITLTCYSDLPGLMEDELIVTVEKLQGMLEWESFRIPMRLLSFGNPLFLPEQQVGLNTLLRPPRLTLGTIVTAAKSTSQRLKVGNNSAVKLHVTWQVRPKLRVENQEPGRKLVKLALCGKPGVEDPFLKLAKAALGEVAQEANSEAGKVADEEAEGDGEEAEEEDEGEDEDDPDAKEPAFGFQMWAEEPPEDLADPFALENSGEPPVRIEPTEAIVPPHGSACFWVHQTASKATSGADGHYKYQLMAKGRFTEDRAVSMLPAPAAGVDSEGRPVKPLPSEPERDVISTLVVDTAGDCVIPHLKVDKKNNPTAEDTDGPSPVFKFTYTTVAKVSDSMGDRTLVCGAVLAGQAGGTQAAGIHSYKVRQVTLTNHDHCHVSCRIYTEGPFRIRQIDQAGRHPFRPPLAPASGSKSPRSGRPSEPAQRPIFVVGKWETITVQVEFMIDSVQWAELETAHVDKGNLVIEYPHSISESDGGGDSASGPATNADLQRVSMVATTIRPRISLWPVLSPEQALAVPRDRADEPPWGQPQVCVVDFGYVHVTTSIVQTRAVLLANETSAIARWRLLHVSKKQLQPPNNVDWSVKEEEDLKARDDKDVFEFDVCDGEVLGPSKDALDRASGKRRPHLGEPAACLFQRPQLHDEHQYEPSKISITFRPKKNELYKSRYRIQVDGGISVDFFCKGVGSYDEEDDPLPFQES